MNRFVQTVQGTCKSYLLMTATYSRKVTMPEQTLEQWVSDITAAHNHHAKAIEVLELRERELNDRLIKLERENDSLRKSINLILDHLNVEITPEKNE